MRESVRLKNYMKKSHDVLRGQYVVVGFIRN